MPIFNILSLVDRKVVYERYKSVDQVVYERYKSVDQVLFLPFFSSACQLNQVGTLYIVECLLSEPDHYVLCDTGKGSSHRKGDQDILKVEAPGVIGPQTQDHRCDCQM